MKKLFSIASLCLSACASPYLNGRVVTACNEASAERNEISILEAQARMAPDSLAESGYKGEIKRREVQLIRKKHRCDSLTKVYKKKGTFMWPNLAEPPPGKEDPFRGL